MAKRDDRVLSRVVNGINRAMKSPLFRMEKRGFVNRIDCGKASEALLDAADSVGYGRALLESDSFEASSETTKNYSEAKKNYLKVLRGFNNSCKIGWDRHKYMGSKPPPAWKRGD